MIKRYSVQEYGVGWVIIDKNGWPPRDTDGSMYMDLVEANTECKRLNAIDKSVLKLAEQQQLKDMPIKR